MFLCHSNEGWMNKDKLKTCLFGTWFAGDMTLTSTPTTTPAPQIIQVHFLLHSIAHHSQYLNLSLSVGCGNPANTIIELHSTVHHSQIDLSLKHG